MEKGKEGCMRKHASKHVVPFKRSEVCGVPDSFVYNIQ